MPAGRLCAPAASGQLIRRVHSVWSGPSLGRPRAPLISLKDFSRRQHASSLVPCRSLPELAQLAAALDEAPAWTLDQAVGLVFGGLLVVFYVSATQIDIFIARNQRKQLGLCEECGGLYESGSCPLAKCPSKVALPDARANVTADSSNDSPRSM